MSEDLGRHTGSGGEFDDPLSQIEAWLQEMAWLREMGARVGRSSEGDQVVVNSTGQTLWTETYTKHGEVIVSIDEEGTTIDEEGTEVAMFLPVAAAWKVNSKAGESLAHLLRLNALTGAKFAFAGEPHAKEYIFGILAKAARETLDKGDLEWSLKGVLDLAEALFSEDKQQVGDLSWHIESVGRFDDPLSQIETWLKEMSFPVGRDPEGKLVVDSEHGEVRVWIDEEAAHVALALPMGTVKNKPKKHWSLFADFLRLSSVTGAKFTLVGEPDDKEWAVGIVARTARDTLDRGDLEWSLQSVLKLAESSSGLFR